MKVKTDQNGEIILYNDKSGSKVQVRLESDTVWLSQNQMSSLFDTNYKNISLHIKNVYREKELKKQATIKESLIVQKEGERIIERIVKFYNLDVIISVGYRVKSKRGTEFRIWATNLIKKHLVKGYTKNIKRLNELQKTINILKNVIDKKTLDSNESDGLLKVITEFNYALDLLDRYDHGTLKFKNSSCNEVIKITYEDAKNAINILKNNINTSELFGNEKDKSFVSSIYSIYQSFDGKDLYPSLEEKAAHLLYFVVKDHCFTDGNKRIAAFLFVWFMEKNKLLHDENGNKRIADNALVALTLMIAESKPCDKDIMVSVVVCLINQKN